MRALSRSAILPAFLAATLGITTVAHAQGPFRIRSIDPRFFGQLAVASDSAGLPHILYGSNRHTWRVGQAWSSEFFESSPSGMALSKKACAFEDAGTLHVAYMWSDSLGARHVRHSRKVGGFWSREDVAVILDQAYSAAPVLALAADATPSIAWATNYNPPDQSSVYYASRSGGAWSVERVSTGHARPVAIDIDVSANGTPHILIRGESYGVDEIEPLLYLRRVGSQWQQETIGLAGGEVANSSYGESFALAVDVAGDPHVTYYDPAGGDLVYASRTGGVWNREYIDTQGLVGSISALAFDSTQRAHVAYREGYANGGPSTALRYAVRSTDGWTSQRVDSVAVWTGSLALTPSDQPVIAYSGYPFGVRIATSGLGLLGSELIRPLGGETWFVGSQDSILWSGGGSASVSISLDGGYSYSLLRVDVPASPLLLQIPHIPTRFAKVRVEVAQGAFTDVLESPAFFTIEATIGLAKFNATHSGAGTRLEWETNPGPEADIHYRVERATDGASFVPIADGLDRGEYVDSAPKATSRYRLIAINGLGEEYVLGETSVAPALREGRLIAVSPNPSAGSNVTIAFRTAQSGLQTDLSIYDASGRRVRTLASESFALGIRSVAWDGRDESGAAVAAGTYFARLTWNGVANATERVTIVR